MAAQNLQQGRWRPGRRTPTSKHVSLEAVPRKQEVDEPAGELVDVQGVQQRDLERLTSGLRIDGAATFAAADLPKDASSRDAVDDRPESRDSGHGDEETTHVAAPNELLMEFIACIQTRDMEGGEKLCRMILMYEPHHAEANSFLSVLEEQRARVEARRARRVELGLPEQESSSSSSEEDERDDELTPDEEGTSEDDSDDSDSDTSP